MTRDPADPFVGSSDVVARMRAFDWTRTSVGPVASWPQSLRSALSICTGSAFPIAIYWGPELVLFYNDAWSPIPGSKHPWALGRPAAEVWPDIWTHIAPHFERVMRTGESTYLEDALLPMHRHGYTEECYFNYTFTGIRGERGLVDGVFNAVIETTYRVVSDRRTRLLQRLAEATGRVRLIPDACRAAVDVLSAAGDDAPFCLVYLVEPGATEASLAAAAGLPDGHPAGTTRLQLGAQDRWSIAEALDQRQILRVDDLASRFGEVLPGRPWPEAAHEALVAPLLTGQATAPAGVLILGASPRRAIDEEYRQFVARAASILSTAMAAATAYEAERSRAEALATIDRAKTVFFSNVSHEFRTPLTLMLGPTEDALASPAGALRGEDLQTVHRNQLRLLKLVNALLDFSRLEAGRMHATYTRVDLAEYTSDLASAFRSAFDRAGLRYQVRCAPVGGGIYVDVDMWEKIVFNLLSNALKFTFDGGVTVSLDEVGDSVRLMVSDTGVGIDAAHLPLLFERFQRVEGVRARTHEGSGIGLALVQELARLHGGTCDVTSTLGKGTSVSVSIPRGHTHLPPDGVRDAPPPRQARPNSYVIEAMKWIPDGEVERAAAPDDATTSSLDDQVTTAPGRVLVVDDNADMREYLTRLLARHWRVDTAPDGERALAAIRSDPPDLILSDVMMPGISGFGLMRAVRADVRTRAIPIVLLSARAGEDARIEGVASGADDYIVKPFSSRELIARINAQMALAQAARERADLLAREQVARREAELQEQHLHALFMDAPVAIAVLRGPSCVVELANPSICEIWRRSPDQVVGRPLFDAIPELRGQPWKDLLDRVCETGRPFSGNEAATQFRTGADGELATSYLNFVYTPISSPNGTHDGVMVLATDVTDQVLAREEMRRLREAAEAASRAKDEFLAMLGHELRNPLAPIRTALELLRLRGVDAALRERQIIERQVTHLVGLVDDLLDVSRITRGKVELRRSLVEASAIVARGIEMASPLLEQHHHELIVDVPREGLSLYGDLARLAQVVANLLTNAAKYTEPNGRIHVVAHGTASDVVLAVRDSGVGIDSAMLPTIFDLFVQERQSLDRSQGGLGLGLTIVRSLVELHGGEVRATSGGRGQGAEFVVTLRRAATDVAPADGAASPTMGARSVAGTRILIVDDNVDAAELLADLLNAAGCYTTAVHDGPSALAVAEGLQPHVALLDIGLPVMDGYELARRFAEHRRLRDVRLVAVTGYGQESDRARTTAAGFVAHLVKPIDVGEVIDVLGELAER